VTRSGEKLRASVERIPTATEWLSGVAITRPPLVATASADALSDQREPPLGRKKSCQKVFRGWPRRPIGNTAQEPAEVSIEVDSDAPVAVALADGPGDLLEDFVADPVPQPVVAAAKNVSVASAPVAALHGRRRGL
jgi:hypothetical protein